MARVSGDDGDTSAIGQALKSVGWSAGVRFTLLPVSAILGIINTRLIIQNFGTDAYVQYGLLVTIITVLPFADLGMATAVMNAIGASPDAKTDPHVRRTMITAIRVLVASGAVMLAGVVVVSVAGLWPTLLGDGLIPGDGPIAAALCVGLIAVTLPFGLGQRVLSGFGKNHVALLIVGFQTPVVLVSLLVMIRLDLNGGPFVAVIPYAATFVISVVVVTVAGRYVRPALGRAIRDAPRVRAVRGTVVFDVAWPTLVQLIALPLALQTDRLILSHVSTSEQLGRYNLAAQMFLPVWQVTSAAGIALWPIFARARTGTTKAPSPMVLSAGFGAVAAAACTALAIASPWLASVASDDQISIPIGLLLAFSLLMVVQAAKFPLGTYMTDVRGLRYQAKMIALMLPVTLGISWVLAGSIGAAGPVVGSIVGVAVFQLIANYRYVRRDLARTSEVMTDLQDGSPAA